jgi:hypothetical protein
MANKRVKYNLYPHRRPHLLLLYLEKPPHQQSGRGTGQSHLKKIAGEDGKTVLLKPYLRRLKRVRQSPRPCEF